MKETVVKTKLLVGITALLGFLLGGDALAFFNPQTGRWLSRDPAGEEAGVNLYTSMENAPIRCIDALGLDIWVFHSYVGFGHEWVVGSNSDGSYWESNFHPDNPKWHCPLLILPCEGIVDFLEKSAFDPIHDKDGIQPDRDDGYYPIHVKTSASVDLRMKEWARHVSELSKDHPWWLTWWPGFNCRDYARTLARQAKRFQREQP
jgi:hypothetical protein